MYGLDASSQQDAKGKGREGVRARGRDRGSGRWRGSGRGRGLAGGEGRVWTVQHSISRLGICVAAFLERDLAVVACARGAGAVYHVCAGELVAHGFVNAGFPGWSWVQHVSASFCHFLRSFCGYRGRRVPGFFGEWEDGKWWFVYDKMVKA